MSAVLRIALAYFELVPVQRWVNLGGLLLVLLGALPLVASDGDDDLAGSVFAIALIGVVLILLTPGFAGGAALRLASARSKLHLRPHGQWRVLLGSTLALTLLAGVATLPALGAQLFDAVHGTGVPPRIPRPLESFQVAWAVMALSWIGMFALSRSPVAMFLFGLVPIMGIQLARFARGWFPGLTGDHVLVVGLGAWGLFSLWYLTTQNIRRPSNLPSFSWKTGGEYSPFQFFLRIDDLRPEPASRATAVSQYLFGCASRRLFVLNGIWIAAIFLVVAMMGAHERTVGPGQMLFMLPFLAFFCAAMGYTTARRARFLWLRAGVDRAGLFSLASRLGLLGALSTWGTVAGTVALFAILREPAHAPGVLLFIAAQAAAATCMFYAGLAIVTDWAVRDVLLVIGLVIQALLQVSILGPNQVGDVVFPWTTLLVLASALALLLRWYGRRQWRALDWQVIKAGKLDWRQG
jgi:hypothetical protein